MNTQDKRVRRTKKLIKNSLAKLMTTKELRNISIKELTDEADISRGAFYTHYMDIYDLYEQMENEFIEDMSSLIIEDPADEYYLTYEKIIDYVHNNADICRMFMDSGRYRDKFSKFFEERYTAIVKYEMKTDYIKEEWRYMIRYQSEGFIALLKLWLDSDFAFSRDKLLKVVLDLDDVIDPLF